MGTDVLYEHTFPVKGGVNRRRLRAWGCWGLRSWGFVVGIASGILLDEVLGLEGGLWDVLVVLMGLGGAVIAIRLVHLRTHPRTTASPPRVSSRSGRRRRIGGTTSRSYSSGAARAAANRLSTAVGASSGTSGAGPTARDLENRTDCGSRRRFASLPARTLAFRDGEAVGWCRVGPREQFARLEASPRLARIDGVPVWSLVCFVRPPGGEAAGRRRSAPRRRRRRLRPSTVRRLSRPTRSPHATRISTPTPGTCRCSSRPDTTSSRTPDGARSSGGV